MAMNRLRECGEHTVDAAEAPMNVDSLDNLDASVFAPIRKGIRIYFIGGVRDGDCLELAVPGTWRIGRAKECEIVLDASERVVSHAHILLKADEEGVWLHDLRPKNGTRLFNLPLPPGDARLLCDGDMVQLGKGGPAFCIRIGRQGLSNNANRTNAVESDNS